MQRAIFFSHNAPLTGSLVLLGAMAVTGGIMASQSAAFDVFGGVILAGAAAHYILAEFFVRKMKRAIPDGENRYMILNNRLTQGRFVPLALSTLTLAEIDSLETNDDWSKQFCDELRSLKRWAKIWSIPMKMVIFYFALRYILKYF